MESIHSDHNDPGMHFDEQAPLGTQGPPPQGDEDVARLLLIRVDSMDQQLQGFHLGLHDLTIAVRNQTERSDQREQQLLNSQAAVQQAVTASAASPAPRFNEPVFNSPKSRLHAKKEKERIGEQGKAGGKLKNRGLARRSEESI